MRVAAALSYTALVLDLDTLPLPALFGELTKDGSLGRLLAACRSEDLAHIGDVTTLSCIAPHLQARATLLARESGVVAGLILVVHVLSAFGAEVAWKPAKRDGESCVAKEALGSFEGPLAGLLTAERTMLNIIARMSGTATLTRRFVDAVAGTRARICDTRKTAPGMRTLQKYSVRCGGGTLHRIGLFDAALYKDNHLASFPSGQLAHRLEHAIREARAHNDLRFVEVEVASPAQLREILTLPAGSVDMALLDNMPPESMREAVQLRDQAGANLLLEASGGITLSNVRAVAETGVDRISVGALTHAAPALDLALEVLP